MGEDQYHSGFGLDNEIPEKRFSAVKVIIQVDPLKARS